MKKIVFTLIVLLALGALGFWWYSGVKQNLIGLSEEVDQSWARIEKLYQERSTLTSKLLTQLGGMPSEEKSITQNLITAQSQAKLAGGQALQNALNDPESFGKFTQAQMILSTALSEFSKEANTNADIKTKPGFMVLFGQILKTETQIVAEQKKYNVAAKVYNRRIQQVPYSWVASSLGFTPRPLFHQEGESEKNSIPEDKRELPHPSGP